MTHKQKGYRIWQGKRGGGGGNKKWGTLVFSFDSVGWRLNTKSIIIKKRKNIQTQ